MANTARTQIALAQSPHFQSRVKAALAKVAWQVLNESAQTANHQIRANYARSVVLSSLDSTVNAIVGWLVERTNVLAFATSYDFEIGAVVTAAGDPDIESQLSTDWNVLAGV